MKYLDYVGLSYLWSKIKLHFAKKKDLDIITGNAITDTKLGDGTTSDDTHGEIRNATGRTVVWNQLVPISGTDKSKTSNGVTFVDNRDGSYTFYTTEEGATAMTYLSLAVFESPNQLHNHKVLLTGIMGGASNTYYLSDVWSGLTVATNPNIITVSSDSKIVHAIKVASGAIITTPVTVKPQIFDLTVMFGAGNEPSTVEAFEALFPLDYYEYNAGTMLGGTVTGFKSTDADGNTLSNLSIPITTLTGKREGSSTSEIMFPYGLNGIANVKDEIDFETGKAIKRIGSVDLGTLTYSGASTNDIWRWSCTSGIVSVLKKEGYTNLLTSKYTTNRGAVTRTANGLICGDETTGYFYITDSNYTSSSDFKAAMSGVILHYELAEPIEYTIDSTPSTVYSTRKDGKEIWLPAHSSAPAAAPVDWSTAYGMNAVEEIDNKAPLASPALTGIPTAPTAARDTNTTQIATTAFVQNELSQYELEKDYSKQYLTFVALESGTISFNIWKSMGTDMITSISYSTDNGSTWATTNNVNDKEEHLQITVNVSEGDKILWKGNAQQLGYFDEEDYGDYVGSFFSSTAEFDAQGNVMSLLYGDDFQGENTLEYDSQFACLFYDYDEENECKVVNARNLSLPATTLARNCYRLMFYGCISLTTAPQLPSTTLAEGCYLYMFNGCTSLTSAPELPAITLAEECYFFMFYGCTSLTTAPSILPATTLAEECYRGMFKGCTSLNSITCLATDISATDCTTDWVENVASSGTFVKADSMGDWTTGDSGIPTGWTVVNQSDYVDIKKYEVADIYAPKASPALTGTPTAPTATAGTNTTLIATTAFVKTAIDNLPSPMIFRGSLGTDGTITSLPVNGTASVGDTYKVITDGTYASQSAKAGDTFICDSRTNSANTWILIPSGDEPSGTVTSITLKATSPISIDSSSAITTSGTRTLSHANSGVIAGTYDSVTVDAKGHVTGGTNPTKYWANVAVAASASYITEPEVKSVKINGSSTDSASSNNCSLLYDTTNKCLKFVFT